MSESKNPEVEAQELRGEIEQTRAELGDTVDALSQKADVKAQAKAKVEDTKQQARENPAPVAGVAAGIAGFLLLLWLIKRR